MLLANGIEHHLGNPRVIAQIAIRVAPSAILNSLLPEPLFALIWPLGVPLFYGRQTGEFARQASMPVVHDS